ncbi:hypothetical protein H7K45_08965 [Mycobacterium yunnanensis]|uniref:Uncharacterized protein n=1 Tax=Mycobacterium yunnanensis TaxID=368477 RepID=A0A9X3C2P2_9MYCO|nr:hypothetical protein [Mycobacterium yunnanensis]MCV7420667.1 hypothetical protein [Mycobacterium yunnanensis]
MHGEADDGVTVDQLADLSAGLLDDSTAARLRRRARTDPEVGTVLAGLDRVRREVAALGEDPTSAAEVPDHVTSAIVEALRAAPPPRRRRPPWRRAGR